MIDPENCPDQQGEVFERDPHTTASRFGPPKSEADKRPGIVPRQPWMLAGKRTAAGEHLQEDILQGPRARPTLIRMFASVWCVRRGVGQQQYTEQ